MRIKGGWDLWGPIGHSGTRGSEVFNRGAPSNCGPPGTGCVPRRCGNYLAKNNFSRAFGGMIEGHSTYEWCWFKPKRSHAPSGFSFRPKRKSALHWAKKWVSVLEISHISQICKYLKCPVSVASIYRICRVPEYFYSILYLILFFNI